MGEVELALGCQYVCSGGCAVPVDEDCGSARSEIATQSKAPTGLNVLSVPCDLAEHENNELEFNMFIRNGTSLPGSIA